MVSGPLRIEVAYSPELYKHCLQENTIVIVIDVLRATSAICAALETGVKKIIPVSTVEEAKEYQNKGYLVGAERNGEQIEGFDFGNSPHSYTNQILKNKTIVLTTTNGTKALNLAKNADMVVAGAFTNISVLTAWLEQQDKNLVFLCSGWKGRFNLEDSLFAGAVIERLSKNYKYGELDDAALASKYLFHTANQDPYKFLRNSSHRRRMHRLNLKKDIKYCLSLDLCNVIPILHNNELITLQAYQEEISKAKSFT